jgi:transposase
MYNAREQNLDIARRFVDGELTVKEAMAELQLTRTGVYYWVREYKHSIGEPVSKRRQPSKSTPIKDEVANEDEISRLSSLSKEELIDEVIKAKVGEARAKKGYEVKGGGVNKEYVIINNKNTK